MEPHEQIAQLKQDLADAKAEVTSLKKALDTREADNKAARDKLKAADEEKAALAAKIPADDAIVLTGDDAKAFAAYKELGTPDVLTVKLGDYDRANSEAQALKRRALVDQVARDPQNETAYRYKPSVLERLLGDAQLVRTDKGDVVKIGDTEKPLDKWLTEDQADFLPALQVQTGTPAARQAGDRRTPAPTVTTEALAAQKRASGEYGI